MGNARGNEELLQSYTRRFSLVNTQKSSKFLSVIESSDDNEEVEIECLAYERSTARIVDPFHIDPTPSNIEKFNEDRNREESTPD